MAITPDQLINYSPADILKACNYALFTGALRKSATLPSGDVIEFQSLSELIDLKERMEYLVATQSNKNDCFVQVRTNCGNGGF